MPWGAERIVQHMQGGRFKTVLGGETLQVSRHQFPVAAVYGGHHVAAVGHKIADERQVQIFSGVAVGGGFHDHGPLLQKILRPAAAVHGRLPQGGLPDLPVRHGISLTFC